MFERFLQELTQLERLIFSVVVLVVGVVLFVMVRNINVAARNINLAAKDAESRKPCNRCGRNKEPNLFRRSPYCHFCRITFWQRTLVAAILGAIIAISVSVLSTVFLDAKSDLPWLDVALPSWLFCVLFYPAVGEGSPSRQPVLVGLSIIFLQVFLIMGLVLPLIEGRIVFSMTLRQEFGVISSILSIYTVLIVYWFFHRRECKACGHRAALKPVEKRHISTNHRSFRDHMFSDHKAAHDEALWKCRYCGHAFWRDVPSSYQGGGG